MECNQKCFQHVIHSGSLMHFYCSQKDLFCSIGWMLGQSPGIIASNFRIHQQTSVTANGKNQQIIVNTCLFSFFNMNYMYLGREKKNNSSVCDI